MQTPQSHLERSRMSKKKGMRLFDKLDSEDEFDEPSLGREK